VRGAGETRLVVVTQPTTGGVGVCVRDQVIHALESGFETTLVAPDNDGGPLADLSVERIPLPMKRRPGIADIRLAFEVRQIMVKADIVHLHSSKAGALGRLAAKTILPSRRPRVIFTPHAWSWSVGGRMQRIYQLLEKGLAGATDTIVAVSKSEAEEGRVVLGDRASIVVIPNGVDLERFAPSSGDSDALQPLLVCVGRLAHQKGQDVAIRALAALKHENARLRLVGSGGLLNELVKLASALDVAHRIDWIAETPDTYPHLAAADIVLIPSRWDGMSLVLLEALAVGAPIVASDVNGVEAGKDAIVLVPPGDDVALSKAIDDLLDNADRMSELRISARSAAEGYDLSDTLDSLRELWQGRSTAAL
jgi:glycosyltransferase involved in cell wall biosynthesis